MVRVNLRCSPAPLACHDTLWLWRGTFSKFFVLSICWVGKGLPVGLVACNEKHLRQAFVSRRSTRNNRCPHFWFLGVVNELTSQLHSTPLFQTVGANP